ncbi:hypothetical protein NC652_012891 [Populus alba x Populus x berolinensis]|nr:hypothetical protein NC652_012891 [Populus alba x Populus x berolinensis]
MKHIAIDFHFVRDKVANGSLRVSHVSTADQLADALTKPLSRQRLSFLLSKIGISDGSTILRGRLSSIKVEKIRHDHPAVQPPCVKNLASIAVESCSNLNYLLTSSMVESLAQLKRLEICNCESMEEIVVPEGIGEGKMMLFPKLLRLKLNGLPKLTRFCTTNLLECHSLKELRLKKCPELKEFISIPSSADGLP